MNAINKYKIRKDISKTLGYLTLYRIEALRNFGYVKKGDLGGWIEKEDNLSQSGTCWVYDEAIVFQDAKVSGKAKVCCHAKVSGYAIVTDNAVVCGNSEIYDYAILQNDVWINDDAHIYGNARANLEKSAEEVLNVMRDIVVTMGGKVEVIYSTLAPDFDGWSDNLVLTINVKELLVNDETETIDITYTANGEEFTEDLLYCSDFHYGDWVEIMNELVRLYTRTKE